MCSRKILFVFAISCLVSVGRIGLADEQSEARELPIGKTITSFTLKDFRGKEHSLDDFDSHKALVIAILGTECPLAKLYAPRLQQLADQFKNQGVALIGINANRQDSISEIAAHARIHGLTFPILKDVGNKVVDQLGAVRTPEVFLLDQKRSVCYHGRIDDQYGVGYIRDEPKRQDLKIALTELLAGKTISEPTTESVGCFIGRIRRPKPDSEITYSNQIARLLQKRCVECHREGEIAPFSLTSYEDVAGWGETISEVVRDQRMPPWHADPKHGEFDNDRHLTTEEKELIYRWVENGAPEGNFADLPQPREYVDGWQLPKQPDLVFPMRETPVDVPAEGEVRYQYYRVDPGFKEDKWFTAAELLPGNRAVVHHILVFARAPGGNSRGAGGGAGGFLVSYVPGLRVRPFPDGMAKRIPAGSQLIFQLHYTPIGSPQTDLSKLGLVLADSKDVKYEVKTISAVQGKLQIPPHEANYASEAFSRKLTGETLLLSMMPHMHLRGKSFRYEAIFPDNKPEILLDIPQYDFNWQTAYRLVEPMKLPDGSQIHCTAHHDNSENNLNNPDPTKQVRWGDQTNEEMMIGYFEIATPVKSRKESPAQSRSTNPSSDKPVTTKQLVEKLMNRFDKNKDKVITRPEVGRKLFQLFKRLDINGDKKLTPEELERNIDQLRRNR